MDGLERERSVEQTELETEREREECRTKEHKTKFRQTHLENTHREQGEGQGRINGCALIDKLIKQTKTSTRTHIKTQTECKADTLE